MGELNKHEAPDGYVAVPKGNINDNACNKCDWKDNCNYEKALGGEGACLAILRKDRVSVYFKRIAV